MKKFLPVLILLIVVLVAYQFWFKKDDAPRSEEETLQPLTPDASSGPFNQSYAVLLNAYFELKESLVASDTSKASAAAMKLVTAADSLKVDAIQGDSTGIIKETASNFSGTIRGSAQTLVGEKDINAKRKEFEMISYAMWSLNQTVQYDGLKVYWKYCPMAFNNKGAYWMSREREIRNPYFGEKMLDCGSVEDSLDYSK